MASSTDRLQELASSLVLADPRRPDQLADLARRIRELVTAGCGAEDASALRALVDAASGLESADDATRAAALAEVSACAERLLATESTAIAPRASAPVRGEDAQLVLEFVTEAQEHLAGAEAGLLALESDPHDSDSLKRSSAASTRSRASPDSSTCRTSARWRTRPRTCSISRVRRESSSSARAST